VSCKEARLGDEAQIDVTLAADAVCINNGSNQPKAVNKIGVTTSETVDVDQTGKANYTVDATATFQPSCSPPMTVEFSNITVTDTSNDITWPR
jgi:hypothetical protein